MSRRPDGENGNGNGDVARGAGYAAFLGAALIGVAVVIGIVLLQIGDRNDNGPSAAANPTTPTTSTTKPPKTTTTKPNTGTTAASAQRAPGAVSIVVLNGGAAAGKAGDMADALKLKGYTNQGNATDWNDHKQTGNSIYCRAGLEREGSALAIAVGSNTKSNIPFPANGPPNPDNRDCIVVVGAPG